MAGRLVGERAASRQCVLRDARQGIEFGKDADDWCASRTVREARDECRRNIRYAGLDVEALGGKGRLQQAAAALLLVTDLGKVPELLGNVGRLRVPGVQEFDYVDLVRGISGERQQNKGR